MKHLLGYVLAIGGGLFMAWVLVAGGGFTAVTTMGCIGTRGREGCDQAGWLLGATVVGTLVGWGVYRLGRGMVRSARRQPRPSGPG